MLKVKVLISTMFFAVLLVGCHKTTTAMQSFKYYENAKRKPIVAMLPVVNRVENYLSWDLSQEFSSEIQRRLINDSVVYLNSVEMPEKLRQKLEKSDSVMLKKDDFNELAAQNDFVVLLELIEHSEMPFYQSQLNEDLADRTIDRVLNMKMRVKITDIRSSEAKVVLHEILEVSHLIPRDTGIVDYGRVVWGSDSYPATAYGRAHARLEKDLSKQIEKYITIAH